MNAFRCAEDIAKLFYLASSLTFCLAFYLTFHFIWNYFWHLFWIFSGIFLKNLSGIYFSICHFFRHSLLPFCLISIYSDIFLAFFLTFFPAFFMASIPTFCLALFLAPGSMRQAMLPRSERLHHSICTILFCKRQMGPYIRRHIFRFHFFLSNLFGDSTGYKFVQETLQDQYHEHEPPNSIPN